MILGMPPLTFLHVVISLVGIVSGFVVVWGLLTARRLEGWTAVFLVSTVLTSVTGFLFFPLTPVKPSHALGVMSLVVLAVAIAARYRLHLTGRWRGVYAVTAIVALYFNFFALVFQAFLKVPALHDLAPTQSEPPFAVAQLLALLLFVVLGVLSAIRFRPAMAPAA